MSNYRLISHKFLISAGCEKPTRYYDLQLDQFCVYYKIEGYDCDILIRPLAQVIGEISPSKQVDDYSDIEFLIGHHTGDWTVYVNSKSNVINLGYHLVTLHTEQELLNLFIACKCPKYTQE